MPFIGYELGSTTLDLSEEILSASGNSVETLSRSIGSDIEVLVYVADNLLHTDQYSITGSLKNEITFTGGFTPTLGDEIIIRYLGRSVGATVIGVANFQGRSGQVTLISQDLQNKVNTSALQDDSVTGVKISSSSTNDGLRAISAEHIKANSVDSTKLANESVTHGKLATSLLNDVDRAVDTNNIKSNAVDTRTLADDAVTSEKLSLSRANNTGLGRGDIYFDNSNTSRYKVSDGTNWYELVDTTGAQQILGSLEVASLVVNGNTVINGQGGLAADSVTTTNIVDLAVTSDKLSSSNSTDGDRAVTTDHIRDAAVTTAKLSSDSVTTTKITDANVTTAKIADLNVTTAKIATDAVDSSKLKDSVSVDADRAVTTNHIRNLAINTAKITDSAVTAAKIGTDAVTEIKILDLNVTTSKLDDNAVTTVKINANAITTAKIADLNVTTAKIADDNVTTAKINDLAVTEDKLAGSSVTTAKLAADAVTTAKITDANVTTAKIADDAVTTAKILDLNVTTAKLAADSVTTAKITDANVTTAKIADVNVTTAKIADLAVTEDKLAGSSVTTTKIADLGVTTAKIDNLSVTLGKLAADAVDGTKIADDAIDSEHYVDGSIDTAHIDDLQVTTAKIADVNVTTAKIADLSVTTAKIADLAVTEDKLAGSSVTTGKIADDAVTNAKLAQDSVDSSEIVDDAVITAKITDLNVTTNKIDNNAVTHTKLSSDAVIDASRAVTTDHIRDNAVTSDKISTNAITSNELADDSVDTNAIADDAVTTAKIADLNITTAKLAADSVTTAKITDLNVTTDKLAASAVTTAKITDANVTDAKLATNSVTTAKIEDLNVTTAKLAASAVTSTKLDADSVDGTKIADDAIDSEHYVDGSIDTAHIGDSQVTTAKIADDNITTAKIADDNVTTAKIADDNVTDAKLASNSVTTAKITDANVTTVKIADDAVTSAKLDIGLADAAAASGLTSEGDVYYADDTDRVNVYDGASWRQLLDSHGNQTITNDLTISGDLTVTGTTTYSNTTNLSTDAAFITLNTDVTGAPSEDAYLEVERGTSTNVKIQWNETNDKWEFTNDGSTYYNLPVQISDLSNNSNYIDLTDVSVTVASVGSSTLSYDNTTGVLTYTPPDLSSFATTSALNTAVSNSSNWDTAFSWGDHSSAGYLTSETSHADVVLDGDFTTAGLMTTDGSGGYSITSNNSSNWDTAHGWGDHSSAGYLTSQTSHADVVVDGDFTNNGLLKRTGAGSYTSVTDNSSNWDTAHGWGDHGSAGYLTSETSHADVVLDGDFTTAGLMTTDGSGTYSITTNNASNWNTAYGWGDHGSAGYLTSQTSHADVVVDGDFTTAGLMTTDGSGTYSITTDNSSNWDTAHGWGDHGSAGYLTSYTETQTLDDVLTLGATTSQDIATTGKILYSNVYSALTDLQSVSAATYHGMFAHVHATGHGYFGHAGGWVELVDVGSSIDKLSDVDTTTTAPSAGDVLKWDGTNNKWEPGTVATGITVKQIQGSGGTVDVTATSITELQFDKNTGFNVTDLGSGVAFVDFGSAFKTWYVSGQTTLVASGEDEIELISGTGITLTTTTSHTGSATKAITIASSGGTSISDGDKGDITVSNSGATWSIDAGVVGSTELDNTGVTANTYGDATNVPQLTVDANGRITGVTNVAITGGGSGTAIEDGDFTSNGLMSRTGAGVYTSVTDNSSNWNTAYGWGDHGSAGYLTSYAVVASDLNGISIDALSDVDTTTTTPSSGDVLKWDGSKWAPAADATSAGGGSETDPVFGASEAASITSTNTSNWNTAYSWGDHGSAGYLTSVPIASTSQHGTVKIDGVSIQINGSGQIVATGVSGGSSGVSDATAIAYAIALS
jgi:hypothetical protein